MDKIIHIIKRYSNFLAGLSSFILFVLSLSINQFVFAINAYVALTIAYYLSMVSYFSLICVNNSFAQNNFQKKLGKFLIFFSLSFLVVVFITGLVRSQTHEIFIGSISAFLVVIFLSNIFGIFSSKTASHN